MQIFEGKIEYKAVGEYGQKTVATPRDGHAYIKDAFVERPVQEQAWIILLDRKYKAMGRILLSIGTLSQCTVAPRDVFRAAILGNAAAIILAHNHPSGDSSPGTSDGQITRQLKEGGELLGVELLDHIIIGEGDSFFSFRENGLIG